MWNYLKGKKTYLLSLATVIYFVSAAMTGHLSWHEAINGILGSSFAATLRNAISG